MAAGADEDFGSARITVDLDDANAVADARDLGLRIKRALDRSTRDAGAAIRRNIQRGLDAATVNVQVAPDLSRFDAALLHQLRSLQSINIPVSPDMTGFVERIRALLSGEEFPITVIPDLDGFDARIRAHRPPTVPVPVDPDVNRFQRALAGLARVATRTGSVLTSALRLGALSVVAIGAAQGVATLVAALAPAAGLIAALPAVVLGFQAALGTLKFALSGVSDSFKSALTEDSKKFEASLSGLSSKAKSAAREVRAMKPAFDELHDSVQNAFFSQIEGQITATAKALQGPLKSGLTAISSAWGSAARGVLGYIQGAQGVKNVKSILGGAQQGVVGLSQTTNKLTAGLLQVAAVVSDKFGAELSGGIANVGDRLAQFLQNAAKGGQAVSWVDNAVTTLAKLGDIAGNVREILSGVFSAASISGAGLLNNLQKVTQAIADVVNSASGQDALTNLFTTLAGIASQIGPILSAALTQIGGLAPGLLPLLTGLGPVIVTLINAVGNAAQGALPDLVTAFDQVGKAVVLLAPALPPLAVAAASLARSAADLLVPLAPVVALLAQLLGPVVSLAAPLIVAGVAVFGLVKAFGAIQGLFALAVTGWETLNAAFIASPIGFIITAVIGLAIAIYLLYQRFAIVRTVVDAVGNALKTAFLAVVGFVSSVASKIGDFFVSGFETAKSAVSTGIDAVVGFFTGLPDKITSAVSSLGSTIGTFFTDAFTTVSTTVQTGITAVVNFFTALPGQILAALVALPGLLLDGFTTAVAGLIIGILVLIAGIVYVFTVLPGKIYDALVSLGSFLITAFITGFNLVTSTVSGWIDATVAFFEALPGRVYNALVALGTFLITAFTTGFNLVTSTVSGWIDSTAAFFSALPGKVLSALSTFGSFLLRNFTSAFNSTKSGISNFISGAVTFFSGLPGKIGSALSALPGKLANAFTSAGSSAKRAVSGLITAVVNLFSGLGSKIVSGLGNIGGQIVAKVKSGLPASVRKYLPFAEGGVVYGPTHALIGEAGPEVVIPLSKPKRAMALAARSGLMGILGMRQQAEAAQSGGSRTTSGSGGLNDLAKVLNGTAKLLNSVGANVVQGMIDGINGNSRAIAVAAQGMANSAVVAAEDTLEINSPSKVFKRIGDNTGKGFIVGFTGTVAQIQAAMQRVADGVVKIGREIGIGFIAGLTGTASQIKSTTSKLATDIAAAFKGVKTNVDDRLITLVQTSNVRLQALAVKRDAIAKQLADAQKFATDTAAAALQTGSLQNLTQGQDAVTARGLVSGLKNAVFQVKAFTKQINDLAARGLRTDLLQQVIGLGPDQGSALATALAQASTGTLKQINSLQTRLAGASKTLGNASADILFDTGKAAGEGFLTGIKSQQKAIEKLMLDIARGMQRAIRTALDIHSPSHVFYKIGEMTGLGLHGGLLSKLGALQDAARRAARGVVTSVSDEFARMSGAGALSGPDFGDGNVVPLTRAQRYRQQTQESSSLADALKGIRGKTAGGVTASGTVQNTTINISEVGNARATAHRVANRLAIAGIAL